MSIKGVLRRLVDRSISLEVLLSVPLIWARYRRGVKQLENATGTMSANAIADCGRRVTSQTGEDGIIAAIMDRIGVKSGKFVEFGFGVRVSNCLTFALTHKNSGLFIDGDARGCAVATHVYRWLGLRNVRVVNAFLDRENVDSIIASEFGTGEIDVLSVDVDGNDYWLWAAIKSVNPRLVIMEYNASFGIERAVTIPYDPTFQFRGNMYHGASLAALDKLAKEKGYYLVACEEGGYNAFFVRDDLRTASLPQITVANAWRPHSVRISAGSSQLEQEAIAYLRPVVEI